MKKVLILFGVLVLIAVVAVYFQSFFSANPLFPSLSSKATIKDRTFSLLIAKSSKDVQVGLSEKTSLPQNTGMLFIFPEKNYYGFWMKNMKFPIDIIYISGTKIVSVFQDAKPPKNDTNITIYKPDEPADRVLEINSGLSQKYGFKKGDEVKFLNLPK